MSAHPHRPLGPSTRRLALAAMIFSLGLLSAGCPEALTCDEGRARAVVDGVPGCYLSCEDDADCGSGDACLYGICAAAPAEPGSPGGGGGGGGGGGEGDVSNFADLLYQMYCEAAWECPNAATFEVLPWYAGRFDSVEACKASPYDLDSSWLEVVAAAQRGQLTYDEEMARECIDNAKARFCQGIDAAFADDACGRIFIGHTSEGQPCATGYACEGNLICENAASCQGTCQPQGEPCGATHCSPGNYCEPGLARCVEGRGEGDSCSRDAECGRGTACSDQTGSCVAYYSLGEGEPCDDVSFCQDGLVCTDNVCRQLYLGGEGEECHYLEAMWCRPGLTCQVEFASAQWGSCQPPRPQGETCYAGSECRGGLFCEAYDGADSGTCTPLYENGQPCNDASVCGSNYCVGQTCQPIEACELPDVDTSNCSEDAICDGRCVDLRRDRDHCGQCGRNCDSGEICRHGACFYDENASLCPEGWELMEGRGCYGISDRPVRPEEAWNVAASWDGHPVHIDDLDEAMFIGERFQDIELLLGLVGFEGEYGWGFLPDSIDEPVDIGVPVEALWCDGHPRFDDFNGSWWYAVLSSQGSPLVGRCWESVDQNWMGLVLIERPL